MTGAPFFQQTEQGPAVHRWIDDIEQRNSLVYTPGQQSMTGRGLGMSQHNDLPGQPSFSQAW